MNDLSGIRNVIAEPTVVYRSAMRQVVGSVEGVLFLNQVHFHWHMRGPFSKFDAPCDHPAYHVGKSWREELGFTERELRRVKSDLCQKVSAKEFGSDEFGSDKPIVYTTNADRVTTYKINLPVYEMVLYAAYKYDGDLTDVLSVSDLLANRRFVSLYNKYSKSIYIDTNVSIAGGGENEDGNGNEATTDPLEVTTDPVSADTDTTLPQQEADTEPKRNKRQEFQVAMFDSFSTESGIPLPPMKTQSDIHRARHSWIEPCWEIDSMYDSLTEPPKKYSEERCRLVCNLIKAATRRNQKKGLTIYRPQSVLASAKELFAAKYNSAALPEAANRTAAPQAPAVNITRN